MGVDRLHLETANLQLKSMLRLFRLPNLLIVAITQYLLQYLVLIPPLHLADLYPKLDFFHFSLLVFTTVLIAAGGYVINDIIDYKTDLINKPDKIIIEKYLSKKSAYLLYGIITLIGAAIAWFLANYIQQKILFLIYPTAVLALFFYSKYLKKMPLWGNLIVAVFCAGVAGIVLFSERAAFVDILETQPILGNKIMVLFSGYIVFAFITTLLREIIKDMEDEEGDRKTGLRTFPIYAGINNAKKIALIISILLMIALFFAAYWLLLNQEWVGLVFSFVLLIIPILFIIHYLKKSTFKSHYSTLSRLIKLVMLSGLILLIVLWKF